MTYSIAYHASHGNSVAALKLDQQQLRQQISALQSRSHFPTNHKQEIAGLVTKYANYAFY